MSVNLNAAIYLDGPATSAVLPAHEIDQAWPGCQCLRVLGPRKTKPGGTVMAMQLPAGACATVRRPLTRERSQCRTTDV